MGCSNKFKDNLLFLDVGSSGVLIGAGLGDVSILLVDGGAAVALLVDELGWGGHAEEFVHLLERHSLGLWDEEPGEREHGQAERTEDEVSSVSSTSNSSHHVRNGDGNHEVEEPLGGCSDSDVHGTKTGGGDLRDENPADWSPAELEEDGEDEDHGECNVSEWWDRLTSNRWVESYVESDDEHCYTLADGGEEKGLA